MTQPEGKKTRGRALSKISTEPVAPSLFQDSPTSSESYDRCLEWIRSGKPIGDFEKSNGAGKIEYEEWATWGKYLRNTSSQMQWAIYLWLEYGEKAYGEKYVQAASTLGYKYGYLRNIVWVGNATYEIRRDNVPWGYHAIVANGKLTKEDRIALLDLAGNQEEEGRAAFQQLVQNYIQERYGIQSGRNSPSPKQITGEDGQNLAGKVIEPKLPAIAVESREAAAAAAADSFEAADDPFGDGTAEVHAAAHATTESPEYADGGPETPTGIPGPTQAVTSGAAFHDQMREWFIEAFGAGLIYGSGLEVEIPADTAPKDAALKYPVAMMRALEALREKGAPLL